VSVWKDHNTYRFRVQRAGRVITGPARTLEEARTLEARARLELGARATGQRVRRTLDEAFTRYLTSSDFERLGDKRNLIMQAEAWMPYIVGQALEDAPDIADRAARDWLLAGKKNPEKGLKPATINRRLAMLRRILNLAWRKWEWTGEAIAPRIELLREDNERHVYLTFTDFVRLRRACADRPARAMITLLGCTGARYSEMAKATEAQIIDGVLFLHARTKRGKPRAVPILPPGLRYARWALPFGETYRHVRYHFDKAKAAIGRPELHLHDLRHSVASWIVQSGGTLKDAQDWLGHTNPVTTQRYAHLDGVRARAVADGVVRQRRKL
jgi:integrase